jgi:hypothetical protein
MATAPRWRPLTAAGACGPTTTSPPAESPKFLSLPFSDPGVSHGQGWYYSCLLLTSGMPPKARGLPRQV